MGTLYWWFTEYFAPLLPNALYDGGVAVHEPSHIEHIGSEKIEIYNALVGVAMKYSPV